MSFRILVPVGSIDSGTSGISFDSEIVLIVASRTPASTSCISGSMWTRSGCLFVSMNSGISRKPPSWEMTQGILSTERGESAHSSASGFVQMPSSSSSDALSSRLLSRAFSQLLFTTSANCLGERGDLLPPLDLSRRVPSMTSSKKTGADVALTSEK